MANLIYVLAIILQKLLSIYVYVIIAGAILSWMNPDPYNPIVRFLRNVTEPVYDYVRRYLPFVYVGGIDLSPIILILLIQFAQIAVVDSLLQLSVSMGRPGMIFR